MKIKIVPLIIILLFIIMFVFFYKGLKNSNIYTPDLNTKKDIPEFTALVFDKNIKINSKEIFKDDQFFLLNIWASWCVPCKDEHPYLIILSKKENLKIVGLNYKDKKNKAKIFLNDLSNPYDLILVDENGTVSIEWGAFGVPETFLIYNKKIIKKLIGPINEKSLNEIVELIR